MAGTIQCGQVIRLTHLETLRNSHSRNAQRPLSVQQAVSAYGDDGVENNRYDREVACNGSKYCERSTMVSCQHVDSGHFWGSSSTFRFSQQNAFPL